MIAIIVYFSERRGIEFEILKIPIHLVKEIICFEVYNILYYTHSEHFVTCTVASFDQICNNFDNLQLNSRQLNLMLRMNIVYANDSLVRLDSSKKN